MVSQWGLQSKCVLREQSILLNRTIPTLQGFVGKGGSFEVQGGSSST